MIRKSLLVQAALAAVVIACQGAAHADVTVGSFDGPNCYPFSCLATDGGVGSEYQQVYSSTAFSGPLNISQVSFTANPGDAGSPTDTATFQVSFYLTSAAVSGLSTTAASNEGALLSNFTTVSMPGTMPAVLTLSGPSFIYDPTQGNLLMDVTITGVSNTLGDYYSSFEADYTGTLTQRYWAYGGSPTGQTDTGAVVTTFSSGVPEPATWALMLVGFGGLGAVARSRRRMALAEG